MMVLEDEQTRESVVVDLLPNSTVYVPSNTAHRTVNVGDVPLVFLGIYPAGAGHDYGAIAEHNFNLVIIAKNGRPTAVLREQLLADRQ